MELQRGFSQWHRDEELDGSLRALLNGGKETLIPTLDEGSCGTERL